MPNRGLATTLCQMRAMILAAGRGERLRPFTDVHPKVLLEVGGKSLIEHHLEKLAGAGFRDIVINTGWLGQQLPEYIGDGSRWGVRIHYSREGWPALETGGGITKALPLLGDQPFLVINGDIWSDWQPNGAALPPEWDEDTTGHLVLVPNPWHRPAGDFALIRQRVRPRGEPRYTFSGIAYYDQKLFANCQPSRFKLAPLLYRAALQGRLSGSIHRGRWFDVGTAERLEAVEALLRKDTENGERL